MRQVVRGAETRLDKGTNENTEVGKKKGTIAGTTNTRESRQGAGGTANRKKVLKYG